jgi:hypothetical protein
LKNKGFKEEKMTQVGLYAIGTSTPLESNKSLGQNRCGDTHLCSGTIGGHVPQDAVG